MMQENESKVDDAVSQGKNVSLPKGRNQTLKWAILAVILVVVAEALYLSRGLFVAASVNGSPITRLSVVRELEKQGGKQALDALITKKLLQAEIQKQGIAVTETEVNDQISEIEKNISAQGGKLEDMLKEQGMTRDDLKEELRLQKQVEKLLADTIQISDEEAEMYIKDNQITFPPDMQAEEGRLQVKEQLKQQKLGQAVQTWIADLKAQARIRNFVNY